MVSILNGLSAMGASVAQYAGSAGIELQKSQLANQAAILADQLATTRETGLQDKRQAFQSGENELTRKAHSADIAATIAGSATNNAATIAAENSRAAANRATQVQLENMRLNAPPPIKNLFEYLGINPDGTPKSAGTTPAAPDANMTGTRDSALAPEPVGDLGLVRYPDGSVGTPTSKAADTPGAATGAASSPMDNPLVRKALGLPAAGSAEATRAAIARDVSSDPEFKYKTAGQIATEVERRVGEASGLGRPRYSFSAPVTMPDPDNEGKTISGVNRQNTKDGSIEFVRTDTNPNRTGEGGIGNRAEVQFARVASAATMAAESAKNIMELPAGSSTGYFGGRVQGGSLMGALKETLTNSLTSQEVQSYNVMLAGIARNLSTIETSGLAPNAGFTKSMESVILKEGDTEITKMRKMAEVRQIVEFGLEASLANPRLPNVQKEQLRGVIAKIDEAIPFTHHDITALDKAGGKTTMNDVMKARGLGGGAATDTTAPASAQTDMYGSRTSGGPPPLPPGFRIVQ